MTKFIRRKIIICPQPQSCQQHISYTDFERIPIEYLQIEVIQFLQQTILATVLQIMQIVRNVIGHRIAAGRTHRISQCLFFGKVTEGVFQRLDHCRFKGGVHCPDGQRTGASGLMGVRYIEIELEQALSIIAKYGNALGSPVDPAPKLLVPAFHLEYGSRIRTLRINQDLFIKRAFVVVAGGSEKACPALIIGGHAL